MIHVFADASFDAPIMSVGYVAYRTHGTDKDLLDMGTRVQNVDQTDRRIDWCGTRAEYYGAIVAVRAVLDHSSEPLLLHLDNNPVIEAINGDRDDDPFEPYFRHAIFSFLGRFDDYHVRRVHRENNEIAHEQARLGLKAGRQIRQGVI